MSPVSLAALGGVYLRGRPQKSGPPSVTGRLEEAGERNAPPEPPQRDGRLPGKVPHPAASVGSVRAAIRSGTRIFVRGKERIKAGGRDRKNKYPIARDRAIGRLPDQWSEKLTTLPPSIHRAARLAVPGDPRFVSEIIRGPIERHRTQKAPAPSVVSIFDNSPLGAFLCSAPLEVRSARPLCPAALDNVQRGRGARARARELPMCEL